MEDLKLHDIKGLVEIPDDSIYYFYGVITLTLLLLIIAALFIYSYIKREKSINLQELYREELLDLDLSLTKDTAYKLTHYGHLLEKNSDQEHAFNQLIVDLEAFKYKKDVPEFDQELQSQIKAFVDLFHAK